MYHNWFKDFENDRYNGGNRAEIHEWSRKYGEKKNIIRQITGKVHVRQQKYWTLKYGKRKMYLVNKLIRYEFGR